MISSLLALHAGQEAAKARQFSEYLLRVGDGTEPTVDSVGEDFIKVPDDMLLPSQTLEGLIDDIYGDLPRHHFNKEYMAECAILTSRTRRWTTSMTSSCRPFPAR